MIRVLGAIVGLAFIVTGPLVIVSTRSLHPQSILVLLAFLLIGATFIRYGVTGRQMRMRAPPSVVIPLLLTVGGLFLASSIDRVFLDSRGGGLYSLILASIYGLVGVALLLQGFVLLKIRRRQE